MKKKKNIVWLASYPKSGNTWFRTFLTTVLGEEIKEPDINDLHRTPIASDRGIFEKYTELESSEITQEEVECLRPDVYSNLSLDIEDRMYIKVHDAFTKTKYDEWLFPPEVTYGVIYLIRNPLDVAVSSANHNSQTIDKIVENLCNIEFCLCGSKKGLSNQLMQRHLTWSGHVESWTKSPNRVCVLRYEDMKLDSFNTFKRAIEFLELKKSDSEIYAAIDKCSFAKLKKQEDEKSFSERPQKCKSFFRKGEVGSWREELKQKHIEKLIEYHYDVMKNFGYIDEHDNLIY